MRVRPPALRGAVVEDRAAVGKAGRDRGGGTPCAEIHWRQVVAHLTGFISGDLEVAQTELAEVVVSPALHRCVIEDRTVVVSARRDRRRRASGAEVDGGEVVTELSWTVTPVRGVTLPELTRDVVSPALHRVVVEERTRVSDAGGDRDCRTSSAEVDGWQVVTHRADLETARDGVALAKLSVVVASPALHRPVRQAGAGVVWSGCDHGGGPTRGPGHAAAGDRRRGLRDRHEDGRHRRDAGCQVEDQLRGPVTVHVDSSGGA